MQLRYSPTSPYVRKVNVLALEAGLDDRIQRVPTNTADPTDDLPRTNPLGKVPALATDEGEALYDSPVICEYLDSLHGGAKFFPPTGTARWTALRLQAAGDGVLDAALLAMIESKRRPPELRWDGWLSRQMDKIKRTLDALETEAELLDGPLTIGSLTVGCALGYLDFRFPELGWRDSHPALAEWYEQVSQRPSFQATVPKDPA
ncbi:MAG: glutathione S-transferase [Kiloniellales bacterium]